MESKGEKAEKLAEKIKALIRLKKDGQNNFDISPENSEKFRNLLQELVKLNPNYPIRKGSIEIEARELLKMVEGEDKNFQRNIESAIAENDRFVSSGEYTKAKNLIETDPEELINNKNIEVELVRQYKNLSFLKREYDDFYNEIDQSLWATVLKWVFHLTTLNEMDHKLYYCDVLKHLCQDFPETEIIRNGEHINVRSLYERDCVNREVISDSRKESVIFMDE